MNWTNLHESSRTLLYSAAVLTFAAVALFIGAKYKTIEASPSVGATNAIPSATFAANAGTLGAITDHVSGCDATGATPRNVTFTVSGITGSVSAVELNSLTFGAPAHSWVGDIEAVLIAPNGASHSVFGRTLATTATSCGDSTDATGPYTFSDAAAAPPNGGWWQTANILGAAVGMTSGSYRTTNIGGAGATIPMPPTSMNPSFTGVANANGTWTLRLSDHGGGDTGSVSAATLSVTGAAVTADANVDFNGDGKTDFVVARATLTPLTEATAPGLAPIANAYDPEVKGRRRTVPKTENAIAPPIYWYTQFNGSASQGVGQLGDAATDFVLSEDFDGDAKDDLVVWTEGAAGVANFKVLQSLTNTVTSQLFGQAGDDPAVLGDYDGDNKADAAVYRCPGIADPAGQCYFFYRGSNANPGGNITYVPWGFGNDGDFFPNTGDFDGDGKNDFCIQRTNPSQAGQGQFVLLRSSDLGIEYVSWGLDSDFIIPGDYDGDGKTDFMVRRTVSGARQHWLLTRTGATSFINWGITGDTSVPGDYDGDGKTDLAIWRGSLDSSQNFFWILNSSNFSVTQFEWGQCPAGNCDYPVANWAVH
jgi:hypothetical protein